MSFGQTQGDSGSINMHVQVILEILVYWVCTGIDPHDTITVQSG